MSQLIENCAALTIKDALKSVRSAKPVEVASNGHEFGLQCQFNTAMDVSTILTYGKGQEPQEIALEWMDLTFGKTAFFICECGRRSRKLYLPPGTGVARFRCRICCHLKYELSQINRNSPQGKLFYSTNRIIKLANKRENMRRIFYAGTYTTRYRRFLKLCGQAGLDQVVSDANDLLNAIKAQ